ncbi:hypothetical protein PVAND_002114 [Polypedilum vanderplanki]|uniref:PDZ domain-containing protein 8 n=1 Tax=Polypedilum vanderplanki TaxID=319348 RepID=A0A9J6BQA8_POLVA|nr:hypothetical protein PVAND_002114 [Polypedilum vanderplanki]
MNLDISNLFLFCLVSIAIGATITLIIQYYIFMRFFKLSSDEINETDSQTESKKNSKFHMPEALMDGLLNNTTNLDEKTSQIKSINLVLQFLFFELRYSNNVRKWFIRKLSLELDELLAKTTIGKFFSKLTISELDLGSQFPEIRSLELSNVELHETEGHIENLDILMDLHYKGDFQLKIDADMVLGKKGSLSMRVKQLTGKARLQFTRKPFTHWSLSFINEPLIDLAIESQIQGRQMQSNVTSLISTAVKKAIRRKHTLPNYKLRFKPFFSRLIYEEIDVPIQPTGTLEVTLRTLTRLNFPSHITQIYATLTLSRYPFVTANQIDDQNLSILLDIEIHKAKNQQIGIIFKQTKDEILIDTIIPNTPAAVAQLKRGDVLLSIEGCQCRNINHVAKLLKSLNKSAFTMRVERTVNGVIKNDAILEDFLDVYEDMNAPITTASTNNTINISFSKNSESVHIEGQKAAQASSSESSISSTPSTSPRKVINEKTKGLLNLNNSESCADETPKKTPIIIDSNPKNMPQHSTIDCSSSNFIKINDTTIFNLNSNYIYLNLNVFGRSVKSDNMLLGYLNIPLENVLTECNDSHLYIEKYMLNPPEIPELSNHPLSSQSGFSSQICFGDACISFIWTPSEVISKQESKNSNEEVNNKGKYLSNQGSMDKLDVDKSEFVTNKKHDFIPTHFNRSTQCDFCGKKIWLKDAVQCRECSMSCHKKCIVRCQLSTVCSGGIDDLSQSPQPDFKVTSVDGGDDDDYEMADEALDNSKLTGHRQSFSDLLAQGIKRVNSANNLNIPTIVSSLTQNSKSLPPTPQHTPSRKPSITQNLNPFGEVVRRLELIPDDKKEMSCEEIKILTEPLMSWGSLDSLMDMAKISSEFLYADYEGDERLHKINQLLSKLRVALDCETSYQHNTKLKNQALIKDSENAQKTTNSNATAGVVPLDDRSEERLQILSVIMLHLCSGLQNTQSNM